MNIPPDPAEHLDTTAVGERVATRVRARIEALDADALDADAQDRAARGGHRPRRRVVLALAGTTAAAATAAIVFETRPGLLPEDEDGYVHVASVTPPVLQLKPTEEPAKQTLLALADRVEKLSDPPASEWVYTKKWAWYLNTWGDAPLGAATAATPRTIETWVRTDGSGHERSEFAEPIFPNPDSEQAAREGKLVDGTGVEEDEFGPAGHRRPFRLPDEVTKLATRLRRVEQIEENGRAQLLTEVGERSGALGGIGTSEQPTAKQRAAVLRLLAEADYYFDFGTSDYGPLQTYTTTTWQGRRALAVSSQQQPGHDPEYPKHYSRQTLLISPDSGEIIGDEEALFGDPLKLNLKHVPATLSITEVLERRAAKPS
ncbi:hypothetical protein [Streptomyces sp. NBC_01304]|uniref:hypothetical protein n=1 Tax=Streptomyces sp. NBC_01304 TaxID=2903818 RepID=UPI002E0FF2FE|nr:hypothetical protein OG430_04875 [Streptomyces sp. NBC_01304]